MLWLMNVHFNIPRLFQTTKRKLPGILWLMNGHFNNTSPIPNHKEKTAWYAMADECTF